MCGTCRMGRAAWTETPQSSQSRGWAGGCASPRGHLWALQRWQCHHPGLPLPCSESCLPFPGAFSPSQSSAQPHPCSPALLPPSTSLQQAELPGSSLCQVPPVTPALSLSPGEGGPVLHQAQEPCFGVCHPGYGLWAPLLPGSACVGFPGKGVLERNHGRCSWEGAGWSVL